MEMIKEVDIYRILKKERFSDYHARVLADQMSIKGSLATKDELYAAKDELKKDIADLRTELKQDIADLRTELKQDISDVRVEIADLRTELKGDIADLRTDVNNKLNKLTLRGFTMASVIFIAVIATNPKALELISKLCGIAK